MTTLGKEAMAFGACYLAEGAAYMDAASPTDGISMAG